MWILYETADRHLANTIESILVSALPEADCRNALPGRDLKQGRLYKAAKEASEIVGWERFMNIDLVALRDGLVDHAPRSGRLWESWEVVNWQQKRAKGGAPG